MKTVKEILLGLALCILTFIVLMYVNHTFLFPHLLGNYADPLYLLVAVLVTTVLAVKKSKESAITFGISAFFLFTPILLGFVAAIGCSIGQCPNF
jgi:hypothetical protein